MSDGAARGAPSGDDPPEVADTLLAARAAPPLDVEGATLTAPTAERPAPLDGRCFAVDAATLDGPVVAPVSSGAALSLGLVEADRYDVEGEMARGGLGRILKATDRRLRRPVALKELIRGDGDHQARFLRETLITACLQHPSIIPLYDAARWENGQFFYSMKLVSGSSLEEAIDAKKTLAERLSLLPHVIDVAEAIAYAHSRKIIHRDLKPQNVLVGSFGETVVIDWGIAKDLSRADVDSAPDPSAPARPFTEDAGLTMEGSVVGTPAYMPPEQAQGASVDERADVYALGAILYHLLAGVPPYGDESVREILGKLLSTPPRPPRSIRVAAPGVPNDLEAIVNKAMAPTPSLRYPSARELANDLKQFQTGQIVGAYDYSPSELVLRWARKNRLVVALLATLTLGATVTISEIVDKGRVAEAGRRVAEQERAKAASAEARERKRADEVTLQQARLSLDVDAQKSLSFLAQLSPSFPRMGAVRTIAADALSRTLPRTLRGHDGILFMLVASSDGKHLLSASYDKTARIWDVATGESKVLAGHTAEVTRVAFSPDGARVVTTSYDRTVRLWDTATGKALAVTDQGDWLSAVAFSPDGRRVASGSEDGKIKVWDSSTAALSPVRVLDGRNDRVSMITFSPDGRKLFSVSVDQSARAWDLDTGESTLLRGKSSDTVELSSGGARLAVAGDDGVITIGPPEGGRTSVLKGHEGKVISLGFSPDQHRLASAGDDGTVRVWDVDAGRVLRVIREVQSRSSVFAFSPDGASVALGAADKTVRIWNIASGEEQILRAHEGQVTDLAYTPDGKTLASAGHDGTVRLWTSAPERGELTRHTKAVRDLVLWPNGKRLASASNDGAILLWDTDARTSVTLAGHTGPVIRLALSPDGKTLASGGKDRSVRTWDVSTSEPRALDVFTGHEEDVRDVAFSPDGTLLASASIDTTVRLWDLSTTERRPVRVLRGHTDGVIRVAFSPDGKLLASSGQDKSVRLWDVATSQARVFTGHDALVLFLAFSPDGKHLASAGMDRSVRLWDVGTGEARVFEGNDGGLYEARFSPQGDLLATASDSGMVRVWDLHTGQSRAFRGHEVYVRSIAFSSGGKTLASASGDGTARLWDVATGESRVLHGHVGPVSRVVFAANGRRLATASDDATIRLWRDELPHDPEALRARLAELSGVPRSP